MDYTSILWFLMMVAFLVAESSTVALVSLWFAFGALAALIASLLNAQLWVQVALFLAVSGALLALLRPMVHSTSQAVSLVSNRRFSISATH